MIVVISPDCGLSSEDVSVLDLHYAGQLVAVIAPQRPLPEHRMRLSIFDSSANGLGGFAKFISARPVTNVILRPSRFEESLPIAVNAILANSLPRFMSLDDGILRQYDFASEYSMGKTGAVTFVYPGVMLPAINGSRQRAFSLFLEFLRQGKKVKVGDFLRSHSAAYRNFFQQFGAEVFALGVEQGQMRLQSFQKKLVQQVTGDKAHRDFHERVSVTQSRAYKNFLRKEGRNSSFVVFSHAWTVPDAAKKLTSAKLVLDCHDINYVRDSKAFDGKGLMGRMLATRNKKLEIARFHEMDTLIAISKADFDELDAAGFREKSVFLPPNFSWLSFSGGSSKKCEAFGFIGTNMNANRASLDVILSEIWPEILRQRPTAKLMVAGTICTHLAKAKEPSSGVIPIGVVPSLQSFYDIVDATLCPVLIQGGLNFKIVESLVAGRPVLVNTLAIKSLPVSSMLFQMDNNINLQENVGSFLTLADELASDPSRAQNEGARIAELFLKDFGSGFRLAFGD